MPIADKLSVILKLITYRYRYIVATDISNHALDGILPHITCFCISTQLECKNTRCVIVMWMPMENGWLQQTSNKRSIDSFKKKVRKKNYTCFRAFHMVTGPLASIPIQTHRFKNLRTACGVQKPAHLGIHLKTRRTNHVLESP